MTHLSLFEHMLQKQLQSFEATVVDWLLDRYNLSEIYRLKLLSDRKRRCGYGRLSLEHFTDCFPAFPFKLMICHVVNPVATHSIATIMRQSGRLPIVRDFDELSKWHRGDERPLVVVFMWPYLKLGRSAMVIRECNSNIASLGTHILLQPPGRRPLVIEPLSALLDSFDAEELTEQMTWAPLNRKLSDVQW